MWERAASNQKGRRNDRSGQRFVIRFESRSRAQFSTCGVASASEVPAIPVPWELAAKADAPLAWSRTRRATLTLAADGKCGGAVRAWPIHTFWVIAVASEWPTNDNCNACKRAIPNSARLAQRACRYSAMSFPRNGKANPASLEHCSNDICSASSDRSHTRTQDLRLAVTWPGRGSIRWEKPTIFAERYSKQKRGRAKAYPENR